ncbi:T9SS type A sorting domain-containing protein [uncultured Algibacter sp.]|uniref:T9SS type A sorting domain-containing protein n=1 Tax=uncultured Algibacter sp. TaxID=298659 RepID=UPI0026119687|nr:T9SS type A sorting domain-containing protein [uncultured Algibacter sp.]
MKKNYNLLLLLTAFVSVMAFGQTATHKTNGVGTSWNTAANWISVTDPVADPVTVPGTSASDIPQLTHDMTLDIDAAVKGLVLKGNTLSGTNTLTIDVNSGTNSNDAVVMSANGTTTIGVPIVINNSGGSATKKARFTINNKAGNSRKIIFNADASITVTTGAELITSSSDDTIVIRCNVSGGASLLLDGYVTFAIASDNTGFTSSFQAISGAVIANNETLGGFLPATATKYQVNGTSSLSLNKVDIMRTGYNVVDGVVFTLNINANQPSMGVIDFANGATASAIYNIVIDPAVTNIGFADSSTKSWDGGVVNITGFKNKLIKVGVGGLTEDQLAAITADGQTGITIDTQGFLNNPILSTKTQDAFKFSVYPNPVSNTLNINSKEVLSSVKVYSLLGKRVLQLTNNLESINVSSLSNGVYILKLEARNGASVTRRIVKQ